MNERIAAYSLVEVLVAAVILGLALAAAASMALVTLTQVETNARLARLVNLHEQAARLSQLGLSPAEAGDLLMLGQEPGLQSLTAVESDVVVADVGTLERATWTMVVRPNASSGIPGELVWTGGGSATRTYAIEAFRSSVRAE